MLDSKFCNWNPDLCDSVLRYYEFFEIFRMLALGRRRNYSRKFILSCLSMPWLSVYSLQSRASMNHLSSTNFQKLWVLCKLEDYNPAVPTAFLFLWNNSLLKFFSKSCLRLAGVFVILYWSKDKFCSCHDTEIFVNFPVLEPSINFWFSDTLVSGFLHLVKISSVK